MDRLAFVAGSAFAERAYPDGLAFPALASCQHHASAADVVAAAAVATETAAIAVAATVD